MPALELPPKCFISHSYRDAEPRAKLLATLPPSVTPFIFPPISVRPDEMVSNKLIQAILDSSGLIYLESGASAESFWVAFERDYALRAGLPVFAFDPASGVLRRDASEPLELFVFPSYRRREEVNVHQVLDVMARERFFRLWLNAPHPGGTGLAETLAETIDSGLKQGGYLVLFQSRLSMQSPYLAMETAHAAEFVAPDGRLRVVPTWLDDPAEHPANWLPPGWPREYEYKPVFLRRADRPGELDRNRLDDLIVRLYWLVYQNTRQGRLD
jgi:hypothetical protein